MAPTLIPYGKLSTGQMGLALDSSDVPIVSVVEVLSTLPSTSHADNFVGRMVFAIDVATVYIFYDTPSDVWISLQENAVVVDSGNPPVSPTPTSGDLFYSTTTEVLYLWDGTRWVGVGGARATEVLWRHYTADGATTLYDTGATTMPPVEYVQVFVDGEAMQPGTPSLRDYYMVGNSVQLRFTPTIGQEISVRTLTFTNFGRNSALVTSYYTGDGTTNSFDTGLVQASISQLFVYVDGVMQYPNAGGGAGTYDYDIITQNLSVSSLTNASANIVTMTTAAAHGLSVGGYVTVSGASPSEYNGTFTIISTPTSTSLTYDAGQVLPSSPATGTIVFGPVTATDTIRFVNSSATPTAPGTGVDILIRGIENIAIGESDGEANTASNLGSGTGIFAQKDDVDLQFKSLVGGGRTDISSTSSEITISLQDKFIGRTSFNGSPSTYVVGADDIYIGVRNSAGIPVAIDIGTNIPTDPDQDGRRLIIKDEARNAGTYQISVVPDATSRINGGVVGAAYTMTTNGASVSMVFDGQDWHIVASTTS